jgi:hypothetical protein
MLQIYAPAGAFRHQPIPGGSNLVVGRCAITALPTVDKCILTRFSLQHAGFPIPGLDSQSHTAHIDPGHVSGTLNAGRGANPRAGGRSVALRELEPEREETEMVVCFDS